MKKVLIILLCLGIICLGGCNVNGQNPSANQNQNSGQVTLPSVPPFDSEDEGEEKKKTYIKSNTTGLRIRSGAGNYTVVGSLDKGDMLEYHGKEGSYYKTVFKEKTAFVSANYCSLVKIDTGSEKVEKAISKGTTLMGYPYVWGSQRYHWGNGKLNSNFVNGEFDCSALVQYVYYKSNKVILDVTSRTQSLNGKKIEKSQIQRGDLLFFTNASRKDKTGIERIGHVGIYFGENYILHTATDHAVIEPISALRWSYFVTARRVV